MRATSTVMAIVILVLAFQVAWQQMRISSVQASLDQARRESVTRAEALANEKLRGRREELVAAVGFLDELYRSADGLQRPGGLLSPETQRVDAEAIGTWILDVYLQARIAGKSDEEARQAITDAIKSSEEWRRKHGKMK